MAYSMSYLNSRFFTSRASYRDIIKINDTHILLVFQNSLTGYTTFKVGELVSDNIVWGANQDTTSFIAVPPTLYRLTETKYVCAYRDTLNSNYFAAVVVDVNISTKTVSIGVPVVILANNPVGYQQGVVLDSQHMFFYFDSDGKSRGIYIDGSTIIVDGLTSMLGPYPHGLLYDTQVLHIGSSVSGALVCKSYNWGFVGNTPRLGGTIGLDVNIATGVSYSNPGTTIQLDSTNFLSLYNKANKLTGVVWDRTPSVGTEVIIDSLNTLTTPGVYYINISAFVVDEFIFVYYYTTTGVRRAQLDITGKVISIDEAGALVDSTGQTIDKLTATKLTDLNHVISYYDSFDKSISSTARVDTGNIIYYSTGNISVGVTSSYFLSEPVSFDYSSITNISVSPQTSYKIITEYIGKELQESSTVTTELSNDSAVITEATKNSKIITQVNSNSCIL